MVRLGLKTSFFEITAILLLLLVSVQSLANPKPPPGSTMTKSEFAALVAHAEKRKDILTAVLNSPPNQLPYINGLVKATSPYLIQHASEPVNWLTWSDESLNVAAKENKLIFLSIGFSTCYWCQVMKKESFDDVNIAQVLNQGYVSIKVDREISPNIDAFYIRALQKIKGTAGWPVTAILTPEAELLHIDSYIDKLALENILKKYSNTHSRKPGWLQKQAATLEKMLDSQKQNQAFKGTKKDVSMPDWTKLNETFISAMDPQHGGLKGEPKFPEASLLLYLLDELQRRRDPVLDDILQNHLYNMASRGLYDHIHGGFHRYVSDEQWGIPHYEKMLYTQALMMMVYSKAWQVFGDDIYRQVVRETARFLINFMKNSSGAYSSAIDAVYQGVEGGFYLYSREQFAKLDAAQLQSSDISLYEKNGLLGIHVARPYRISFEPVRTKLSNTYKRKHLMIDDKVLTSWNALLAWAFGEAWMAFGDHVYRSSAIELMQNLWRLNVRDNQVYRASFKGLLSGQAVLEDYAFLTRATINLYDMTNDRAWLEKSEWLFNKSVTLINNDTVDGIGTSLNTLSLMVDGELFNPVSLVYESGVLLAHRLGGFEYKDKTSLLERLLVTVVEEQALQQFSAARVLKNNELGRLENIQYFAVGNAKVTLDTQSQCTRLFKINMNPHWHINSNEPLTEDLISTSVETDIENFDEVHYPNSKVIKFGNDQRDISVFENTTTIIAQKGQGRALLRVQACSTKDNLCLLPETLNFALSSCIAHLPR